MKILRQIWAVYGILVFSVLLLFFFPFYLVIFLFFPRTGIPGLIWFNHHVYARLFFAFTLIRLQVVGRKKLDRKQAYIIVSNHRTNIDFIANAIAFPGIYRYLAKKELAKVPLFGMVIKRLCVLVDRSSMRSRARSIAYLRKVLASGISVFIYPEGTRNRSTEPLGTFHQGAFRLALATGAPIAVQTIVNATQITGADQTFGLFPGNLRIVWSEPIPTEGLTQKDLPQLMQQVRETMLRELQPTAIMAGV